MYHLFRRLIVITAGLCVAGFNQIEKRHGKQVRAYNAGHHGAVTTKRREDA